LTHGIVAMIMGLTTASENGQNTLDRCPCHATPRYRQLGTGRRASVGCLAGHMDLELLKEVRYSFKGCFSGHGLKAGAAGKVCVTNLCQIFILDIAYHTGNGFVS
jgi:hypothetical protein